MIFNPNFDNEDTTEPATSITDSSVVTTYVPTGTSTSTIVNTSSDVLSMSNLLNMTLQHVEDDKRSRDEVNQLTDELNGTIPQMSIKELLEYLKIKIKEREFHVDCIFKAFNFVQRTELAKEILIGSERKERIIEATDRSKVSKLLGMLNLNSKKEE